LEKIIENKDRWIRVMVGYNSHKYDILSETSSLKGSETFINEYLILEDQAKLRKEVQKVKEARNEGKWAIIKNRKSIIRDRYQRITINRNLRHFGSFLGFFWAFL
jgi:hypothetical protein